jgi:signal transduction histidine kinase
MGGWLKEIDAWLSRKPRSLVLGLCLLTALVVGVADYFVYSDLLVLYLAPLFVAAWHGGSRAGYVVAIYAAGASFVTKTLFTGSSDFDASGAVTLAVRLVAYLAIALVVVRLRESRRQQEELVGFIVHDLRSPISSAITGLQTLEQVGENLNELEVEMVQLALVSNRRALTLVNSILDVAKLESGKMEVKIEDVDLTAFFAECMSTVELWAQGAEVEIVPSVRRPQAHIDRDLTARVIVNLLSNALKFSPAKSTITVGVEDDAHGVRFWVEDQGPGIPPEYAETIFEPFSQVKGTSGGTGLGLTFCRLAVTAQGGRIGVKSTLGSGSTFWFVLPHAGQAPQSQ